MRVAPLLLALSVVPGIAAAQRKVDGNRIISTRLPDAVLEVAAGMTYAGTQSFPLYNVADAEQHFFVELDGQRIKRLLWVQFEGYFDSNDHTYNYRDSTISHAGRTWHQRINAARIPDTEPRPDSDGARARAFLRAKGWIIPQDVLTERLVWLLDTPPRHELMVIYLEDLGAQGLTAADFAVGGKAEGRFAEVSAAFHRRALASFTIR